MCELCNSGISHEATEECFVSQTIEIPQVKELIKLVKELADPDPCEYDHHDFCQAHSLHPKPCPHGRAKTILNKIMPEGERR